TTTHSPASRVTFRRRFFAFGLYRMWYSGRSTFICFSNKSSFLQQSHRAFSKASRGHVKVCVFELLHEHCGNAEEEVGLHVTLQVPVREADLCGLAYYGGGDGCCMFLGDTGVNFPRCMGDGLTNRLLAFVYKVHDLACHLFQGGDQGDALQSAIAFVV